MDDSKFSPVRKQTVVRVPTARAFQIFTENIDAWWPRTHKIGGAALARVVLEPRANGRWYEIGEDGAQCEWGRVLTWEPPRRLVLAWQISGRWQYDPTLVTEVEVTFAPHGDGSTEVRLEHRNLERFGESMSAARAAFESPEGWGGILARYAGIAEGGEAQ